MAVTTVIALAVAAFAATNVDDIFILVGFMAHPSYRPRDVVLGQFLGGGVMTLLCFVLALAAIAISPAWFGFLGLLVVAIGIRKLWSGAPRLRHDHAMESLHSSNDYGEVSTVAVATIGGFGDNIGVYVPLFATRSLGDSGIVMLVFGAMTGLWCLAAFWLVYNREWGQWLRSAGYKLLPWLLIVLGVAIVSHAGTFGLFFPTVRPNT